MGKAQEELDGGVPLLPYGDRFENWYLYKTFLRRESFPLKGFNLEYSFPLFDYNYRFIMPEKVSFSRGTITYTAAERLLGVFRFPRNSEGEFFTPLSVEEIQAKVQECERNPEMIQKIMEAQAPLVFNAFKIPRYGFEYIDVSEFNFQEISSLTSQDFVKSFRIEYEAILEGKISEVKEKILSTPDNLLILQNTLDRHLRDLEEVSLMTEKIIHI